MTRSSNIKYGSLVCNTISTSFEPKVIVIILHGFEFYLMTLSHPAGYGAGGDDLLSIADQVAGPFFENKKDVFS